MRFIAIAIFLLFALPVKANTVSFSVTIDEVGQNYFGGGVVDFFHVGDLVHFSFTYTPDDSVPPGDPNGMKYVVTEFTLSTPAYSATVYNHGAIKIFDGGDGGSDVFEMTSGYHGLQESYGVPLSGVPLLNGYYMDSVGFTFYSHRDVFNGDSLTQQLNLDDFILSSFAFSFREPGTTHAMGTMQSWTVVPTDPVSSVPVPGALLLFISALTPITARAIYKKKRLF